MTRWKLGHCYDVPVVRGRWYGTAPADWPVLGPRHDDREIIGFDQQHYHLDGRFIAPRLWRTVVNKQKARDRAFPAKLFCPTLPRGWAATLNIVLTVHPSPLPTREVVPLGTRRLRLRRQPPPDLDTHYAAAHGLFTKWYEPLQDAYQDARLRGHVCPHRGADLTGLPLDDEGCVTCPLHGLRWHVESGRLRRSRRRACPA